MLDAAAIAELELTFDRPIPKAWPNQKYDPKGRAFPDSLVTRAQKRARATEWLTLTDDGKRPALPKRPWPVSSSSSCWWAAHAAKGMKALVFFDKAGRAVRGVEEEMGLHTSVNPDYPKFVAALREARSWPEERARAVAPEMLWGAQRRILEGKSDNPYLPALAAGFLARHGAGDVVDFHWGKAGSEPRAKKELEANGPFLARVCPPGA